MPLRHYILGADGVPVLEPDLLTWARWMDAADRRIGRDTFGELEVSTVFLALDHNYSGVGPPILFETMVFYGRDPVTSWRCGGTAGDAHSMHDRACRRVQAGHVQPWGEVEP